MRTPHNFVKIAAFLFMLIGFTWILFSINSTNRVLNSGDLPAWLIWVLSIMMFGNGLVLIAMSWGIWHQKRFFYWAGLAVLLLNIVLTFTDQFGFFDLITLIFDLGLFGFLIFTRKLYLFQ